MRQNKIMLFLMLATFVLLAWSVFQARAQQNVPFPWISWKAQSYIPAGFMGKILPSAGSPIAASIEVVDGGKTANLTQNTIYWYANSQKIGGGVGVEKINFQAPQASGVLSLRVVIQDYRTGALSHTIQIPIVRPLAVIESLYPNNEFFESQIYLKAIPYFFNVTDQDSLAFSWRINGAAPESQENPKELTVNINPDARAGSTLNISLSIANALNSKEQASAIKNLTLIK